MNKPNKSETLVSVGIPFYNSEKYLAQAILSVLKQTYTHWELILIDDGSSDNSLKIARDFESRDTRIKVISDGTNKKLPTRLNQLSQLASGEFYARMDADDLMHPDRLKTQVDFLQSNPEVDLVGTGLIAIDGQNNIIGIRKGSSNGITRYSLKNLISGGWCVHPTIMGKTTWFKKNSYDETLTRTEDFDMWIRTIQTSYFSKMDFFGLYYREESELSLKKYITSTRQSLRLYWKNKAILGIGNAITYSILKILKLAIYLFFHYTGLMYLIVKKRSVNMELSETKHHDATIESIISEN